MSTLSALIEARSVSASFRMLLPLISHESTHVLSPTLVGLAFEKYAAPWSQTAASLFRSEMISSVVSCSIHTPLMADTPREILSVVADCHHLGPSPLADEQEAYNKQAGFFWMVTRRLAHPRRGRSCTDERGDPS